MQCVPVITLRFFTPEFDFYNCYLLDVLQEDSGNYTCEVRGPRSVVLNEVTHFVLVRGQPLSLLFDLTNDVKFFLQHLQRLPHNQMLVRRQASREMFAESGILLSTFHR